MNSFSLRSAVLTALGIGSLITTAAPGLLAQSPQLEELSPETGWFIRLGGFVRTGAKMSLKDLQAPSPALGTPGTGFTYDNGFVKPDASGSATDTYNWGYTGGASESHASAPQYVAGGTTLNFQHLANGARVGSVDLGDQSLFGGQITSGFEISRFKIGRKEVKWGFEAGYAYSTVSASANAQAQSANATLTTGAYSLLDGGGVLVPPQAPFIGSAGGPNFLLPRTPVSSTSITAASTASLTAAMDANVHSLRVGPWFELPVGKRTSVSFSLGYVTTLADAELRLTESTVYAGNAIPGQNLGTTSYRRSEWVPGAYAQLRATYMFTKMIGAYVGAEVQWNKDIHFVARSREADLRFGATFGGVLGLNLSF